jgi:2-polyprenyl-3-methyl-5-hydroxy-6-metoxy-1,4-benzoquinol methylase
MRRHYRGISINTSKNTHESVFELVGKDTNLSIVEIPSGSGAFVQRLKDAGYNKITAIDIENILEIEHDDFTVGDMTETLPLSEKSSDLVVCIDGIEHISKQFDFVSEVYRILKDKGEFIISTPNISSLKSRWLWFTTGHHHKCNSPLDENNPTPLHHFSMISFPEIRYLLHTNGFEIIELTSNRIKPGSLLYALFVPLAYISTAWVYAKTGKKQGTSEINRSILKKMFSMDLLFGETLIVKAVKL